MAVVGAVAWVGNGASQTITPSDWVPDLVITGGVNTAQNKHLFARERGDNISLGWLAQAEAALANSITWGSGNFSLGSSSVVNGNGNSFIAWGWEEGTPSTTGFEFFTYIGNGVSGRTVSHSLGVVPGFYLVTHVSETTGATPHVIQHSSLTVASRIPANNAAVLATTIINARDSSTFTTSSSAASNSNGATYLAYLWGPKTGISAFGSYVGDGLATGPTVSGLGFTPRIVLIRGEGATHWTIYDTTRQGGNPRLATQLSSTTIQSSLSGRDVNLNSDGFQVLSTNADLNTSGTTYYWCAWGESAGGASGTINAVIASPTCVASGSHGVSGSIASTIAAPLCSASGVHGVSGSISSTIAAPVCVASGSHTPYTGTINAQIAAPTCVASGAHGVSGSISATIASPACTASGTHTPLGVSGTINATIASPPCTASGTHGVSGSISAAITPPACTATGTHTPPGVSGTITATIDAPTCVATGTHGVSGTINATIASPNCAASGAHGVSGAISGQIDLPICTASGSHTPGGSTGEISASIESPICVAVGAHGVSGAVIATVNPICSSIGVAPPTGFINAALSPPICIAAGIHTGGALATLLSFEVRPLEQLSSFVIELEQRISSFTVED